MKKLLIAAAFATALGAAAGPAAAQMYVEIAPPAPRHEFVPAPRHGYVWAEGHWEWNGHRYRWVSGTWIRARPGYRYYAPQWHQRDGRWYYDNRGWVRDHDRDGVPDRYEHHGRGDRDRDGVPNRYDHDRDNDGVPNQYDRRPNDPRRS
jgi:hypothetical protein